MNEAAQARATVRAAVWERDQGHCRICGIVDERNALHHIQYRSAGGADTVVNLITLCWLPWQPDCHLQRAHANKRLWQPLLEQLVEEPGVTGLQLLRWRRAGLPQAPSRPPTRPPPSRQQHAR